MTRPLLTGAALAALVGCAPPPAPGTDAPAPTLQIVFPTNGDVVDLDANGQFTTFLAVYLDGIVFAPDHAGGDAVAGEAHWEVEVNNVPLLPPTEQGVELSIGGLNTNDAVLVHAFLVSNDDHPYSDASAEDYVELVVGAGG